VEAERDELKYALEALLFASEKPLTAAQLRDAFTEKISAADIEKRLEALKKEYEEQGRGFCLIQIAGGYQTVSDPRYAEYLQRFYQSREKKRVSQAGLETLSIIAYRQPVTKAEIEFVRGVNVDGPLKTLLEKGLIRIAGRKEVPGRPILYGTSQDFLERFGLKSLEDLPPLSQFTEKDLEPSLLPPEMKAGLASPNTLNPDEATGEDPIKMESPESAESEGVDGTPSESANDESANGESNEPR